MIAEAATTSAPLTINVRPVLSGTNSIVEVEVEPNNPAKYLDRHKVQFIGPRAHEMASEYARWIGGSQMKVNWNLEAK